MVFIIEIIIEEFKGGVCVCKVGFLDIGVILYVCDVCVMYVCVYVCGMCVFWWRNGGVER